MNAPGAEDADGPGPDDPPFTGLGDGLAAGGFVVFAGFAKRGDVFRCSDHGCSCGWDYKYDRGEPMGTEITFGSLTFEKAARHLTVHGQEIELTPSELAVLELLISRPGRIVSKADIFNSLYSWQDNANMSAVEVFISRLRRKLSMADADVGIRVFRGLGYRLEKSADARVAAAEA
jgi:DNA-binding response OmpR family regulator